MEPPSAQSPFAQGRYYPHWGDVYAVSCKDITPRSSLLRTHSPIPFGSSFLRPQPRARSLRRLLPAPAAIGIFPTLSLRIFPRMLGPLPRRSHRVPIPVSSSVSSAFPQRGRGRLPASIREYDFSRELFSRLQTFLYVQASEFARLPDRSYRCACAAGQPRLLHPGRACFVASARTGYASRPNTGNCRHKDFHLARFAALSAAPLPRQLPSAVQTGFAFPPRLPGW